MKKNFALALVLWAFAPVVFATELCQNNCADVPTCEELGYQRGLYCPEGYIVCPFDRDYIWCKSYTCGMGGLYLPSSVQAREALGYKCHPVRYHGLDCYNCDDIDSGRCRWNDDNKGEGQLDGVPCPNGNYPDCIRKCREKDKSAEMPSGEGVVLIRRMCVSCGISEEIVTGFECAQGYVKTENGCVSSGCPTPSTHQEISYEPSDRVDCSDKAHPEGWLFEQNGSSGGLNCSRCVPKDCEGDFHAGLECLNEKGYEYSTNGYSGDSECGYCTELSCNAPYSSTYQSVNDCPSAALEGWSVEKAWTYSEDENRMAGALKCGKCTPKECVNGFSESIQSVSDCLSATGYTFVYDNNVYSGDKYCGKCQSGGCVSGDSSILTPADCSYPGTAGATVQSTGYYDESNNPCNECVCDVSTVSGGCQYTQTSPAPSGKTEIGEGGQGVNQCCDGDYRQCQNISCTGNANQQTPNSNNGEAEVQVCWACGVPYATVTSCFENYQLVDGACVPCDCCHQGENCSLTSERCIERDGDIVPKTCEYNGTGTSYASSCSGNCYNCTETSVSTCTSVNGSPTTLDCYEATDKNCSEFCGAYRKQAYGGWGWGGWQQSRLTVVNSSNCSSNPRVPLEDATYIYFWLTNSSASGQSVSLSSLGCNKTCYADDTVCSAGVKMTDAEVTAQENNGYTCTEVGFTALGSKCYTCEERTCPSGAYNDETDCNTNCSGTCSGSDGCYTCEEDAGCPEGWSDDYMICRNCPAHCLAENGCFRCNAAYCAVGTYEEVADCESACNGTCVGPNGEGCYECEVCTPLEDEPQPEYPACYQANYGSDGCGGTRVSYTYKCNEDEGCNSSGCCVNECPDGYDTRCVAGHCLVDVVQTCEGTYCFLYNGLGESSPSCQQCNPALYML